MHISNFKRLMRSKRALAVPVTYLILFVSLMAVISATYSYAVVKIGSRAASIKAFVAKQNMQALDNAVRSVAWGFGASEVVYMDECGGVFKTEPTSKNLVLNFTNEQTFYDIVFNSSVGKASYQLESSESNYLGLYIRGDNRAVINQSSSIMTQLYVVASENAQTIILCYRPLTTTAVIDTSNGKPVNLIRVNIINLNFSQELTLREKFYLKITAINVTTISSQYMFNESISSLALKASLDENSNVVWLPISSSTEGAIVNLDIVICNIKIEKAEV